MPNSFDPSSFSPRRRAGRAWIRRQWRNRLNQTPQTGDSARRSNVTPMSRHRQGQGGRADANGLDLPPLRGGTPQRPTPSVRPLSSSPRDRSRQGDRPIPVEPRFGGRSRSTREPQSRRTPPPSDFHVPVSWKVGRASLGTTPTESQRNLKREPKPDRRSSRRSSANKPPSAPSRSSRRRSGAAPRRNVSAPVRTMLYGARLAIAGVGLSAIAGTMMALWVPADPARENEETTAEVASGQPVAQRSPTDPSQVAIGQELTRLDRQIRELVADYPGLTPGLAIVDVATGDYAQMSQGAVFPAASTIKLPILVAFFQAVDAGTLQLDERLVMEPSHIAEGSGSLQYEAPGTSLSALAVATLMMVQSDNTATNMLVDRLGGAEALNGKFRQWGMMQTAIRNPLPDLQGTNTTTPQELARLFGQLERGNLLSMASRDRLLRIMMQTENDTLLPQGLSNGAAIAHKTGNLRSVLADVGLIDAPNGKRYVAIVLVKRPDNDERAADLIRQISSQAYSYFVQPTSGGEAAPVEPKMADTQQAQR